MIDTHKIQEKLNIFVYLRKAILSKRVLALTHAGFLSDNIFGLLQLCFVCGQLADRAVLMQYNYEQAGSDSF